MHTAHREEVSSQVNEEKEPCSTIFFAFFQRKMGGGWINGFSMNFVRFPVF
jgi:hypothetical protein